jgi:hypothetical protein
VISLAQVEALTRKQRVKVTLRKWRYAELALICCASCLILLSLPESIFSQNKKPVVYKRIISIDQAIFPHGNLCVPLVVAMTSGDFFNGLRMSATQSSRRFYKHNQQITEFPSETTVFVRASMLACSPFPYVPVSREEAEDFMSALNFELEWQSPDLGRKPVEGFTLRLVSPPAPVWPENEKPVPVWTYILTVKTKGVPLTDDLVVTMHSETGNLLSRMAVHL